MTAPTNKPRQRQFPHVVPPKDHIHIREYCDRNDVTYSMVYSRLNQSRVPFVRIAGKYYISEHLDPQQFRVQNYARRMA